MSGLLEIYYSGNYDAGYLRFMEEDVSALIIKCEKRMLGDFNALTSYIETYKDKLGKKTDKAALLNQVNEIIESVSGTDESVMKKALRKALYSAEKAQEYCITADGAVYLKNA